MRHFVRTRAFAAPAPVAALALGMTVPAASRVLIPASRPAQRFTPSEAAAARPAVVLAPVTARADEHLAPASGTEKQPGIVHCSPWRGGLDDPRSPGNTALGAVRKCGSGRSLGRDRQVSTVRGCVCLLADSDLTPTHERRHRRYARRAPPLAGSIGSGGKQRHVPQAGAVGRFSAGSLRPAQSVHEGCSPNNRAFSQPPTYRNIIIRKFGDIAGEIDVFVVFGDRAIVLQAKSKRLRLEARKGNIQLLQEDFQKAVQDAVDQAYDGAALLADPSITLCTTDDREIQLTAHPLKKIYPITVVSDHYPSLAYQAKHFLNRRRVSNVAPPLITDVFALDSITEMLNSPLRVLSYLELHERHGDKLFVNHEQTLLSLHLKQNLWVGDDTDSVFVNDDVALTLDVAMSVRRDGVDGQAVPDGILTQFRGTHFEKIVSHMEFKDESAAVAMGFFLLEMNEDAIVELNRNIDQLLDRTAADSDFHNFSIGFSDPAAGLTVYCGPVVDPAADLMLGQHCKFRKYCGKADRWLGLRLSPDGSILDMLALESDWKYDLRQERTAKRWLTPKRGKRGRSHKLGRNDLCPCGSGKKYKRCCLHNS